MNKQKILFVGQNLYIGGVQKAFVNLLNKMAKCENFDITVYSFAGGNLKKEIPKNIKVTEGGRLLRLSATPAALVRSEGNITDIILRVVITLIAKIIGFEKFYGMIFKKQKEKYDIAVSYFTDTPQGVFYKGTNMYVSDYVSADKKIAWMHTDPILGGFNTEYCRRVYKPFDEIVCVSDAVCEKFNCFLPEYGEKTRTVHNVFDEDKIKSLSEEFMPFSENEFNIVTIARADNSSKRIDGIINICKRLKEDGADNFKWYIVGDGPDLEQDKELSKTYEVDDIIIFDGEKENPYPYIKKADLFALYSAYEGFPLVIGEAMILNTPILTTNYAAAKEQIPSSKGIIAQTDEEFYQCIKNIIIGKN